MDNNKYLYGAGALGLAAAGLLWWQSKKSSGYAAVSGPQYLGCACDGLSGYKPRKRKSSKKRRR